MLAACQGNVLPNTLNPAVLTRWPLCYQSCSNRSAEIVLQIKVKGVSTHYLLLF